MTTRERSMVLLVAGKEEFNLESICRCLSRMKIPYLWLDPGYWQSRAGVTVSIENSGTQASLRTRSHGLVTLDEVGSVWTRGARYTGELTPKPRSAESFGIAESRYTWEFMWEQLADRTWMNPLAATRAVNRLDQLRAAASIGWLIPPTIASTESEALNAFLEEHEPCITKVISQGNLSERGAGIVMTTLLPKGFRFDEDQPCPVLLQELVQKKFEIRAAVVGEHVLAGEMDPNADPETMIDSRRWPLTSSRYRVAQLDSNEESRLKLLNKRLGYMYSSMDLIRNARGDLVFLEANPCGQWDFLEKHTSLPITEAICRVLSEPLRSSVHT